MPQRFHARRLAGFAIAAFALGTAPFAGAADTPTETPSFKPAGPSVKERLSVARKAIDAKDWNKALNELNLAAREDPRNADVQNLLGYSLRNSGQLDKAFTAYNNALRLDPKHKGAHEYIGIAYLQLKQPAKAQEHLVALKGICGDNCEETQDLAKAIAAYKP